MDQAKHIIVCKSSSPWSNAAPGTGSCLSNHHKLVSSQLALGPQVEGCELSPRCQTSCFLIIRASYQFALVLVGKGVVGIHARGVVLIYA